jgi:hypothetical protein
MRRGFGVLAAGIFAVGLLAVPAAASSTHTLGGTVTLSPPEYAWPASQSACAGPIGTYADVKQGAQVRVTDGSGHLVGLGTISAGTVDQTTLVDGAFGSCVFHFRVTKVPERNVYKLAVNRHQAAIYWSADESSDANDHTSLADMKRTKWTRRLALGFVSVGARLR